MMVQRPAGISSNVMTPSSSSVRRDQDFDWPSSLRMVTDASPIGRLSGVRTATLTRAAGSSKSRCTRVVVAGSSRGCSVVASVAVSAQIVVPFMLHAIEVGGPTIEIV